MKLAQYFKSEVGAIGWAFLGVIGIPVPTIIFFLLRG